MADFSNNPYRPGFGQVPDFLGGRAQELLDASYVIGLAVHHGVPGNPIIFTGYRGVGKTVLLSKVAALAREQGWVWLPVEAVAGSSLVEQFRYQALRLAEMLGGGQPVRQHEVTTSVSAPGGLISVSDKSAPMVREVASDPVVVLTEALGRLIDVLPPRSGVVVSVDELQSADGVELSALGAVMQQGGREGWPVLFTAAGLPSAQSAVTASGKRVTYLERATWISLGLLGELEARQAVDPDGSSWEPEAVDAVLEASGGYPYAIQAHAYCAWARTGELVNAGAVPDRVPLSAVRESSTAAERMMDGLYRGRWTDASPQERQYLGVVAELLRDEGVATSSSVAARMGRTANELATVRDRLIKAGTIVSPAVGTNRPMTLVAPGLARWISSHGDVG